MRVIMAGGGTGGHVIPALAIAREVQKQFPGSEVLFIGTARGMENRLVPQAGYPLRLVHVGQLKNVSVMTRLRTLFDLPLGIVAAARILREFKPEIVIGVGGYASGPAMMAAVLLRIPTMAFEPNVVPGFANRVVAKLVDCAAVHFDETRKFFRNAEVTGVPVRSEFFEMGSAQGATFPRLLITGGSQGAHAINMAVASILPMLKIFVPGVQIVHQTGERDLEAVRKAYADAGVAGEVSAFIDGMAKAFAHSDVIICRSGASTVAEIAAAGKAAIFIPFPRAADDHQRRNAEALSSRNAAVLIQESELTPLKLGNEVVALLKDGARRQKMGDAARALSHADAVQRIVQMAAKAAGKS